MIYKNAPVIVDSYDVVYGHLRREDVAFYVDLAREAGGPVLELGCGTGRVLIPSAAAGARITGLDSSDMMLDVCRRKLGAQPANVRARTTLIVGDMTAFRFDERFALITIPFRPVQHLISVEEQLACMSCVREHLADDGLFIFDVFHPDPRFLIPGSGSEEEEDCPESPLPDGRTMRRTARRTELHRAAQINQIEFNYYVRDGADKVERFTETFPMRYYYRYELEHLLARVGLKVVALYGDFQRGPFVNESREMIFTARKAR